MKKYNGRNNNHLKIKNGKTFPKNIINPMFTKSNKNIKIPFNTESISQNNTSKKLNKSRSFQTKKIMEDFKVIIKQTQALKNKIMNTNYGSKYENEFNMSKENIFLKNKYSDNISTINKDEDLDIINTFDDFIYFNEIKNNNMMKNKNYTKNKVIYQSTPHLFSLLKKQNEIKSIKISNKKLVNSNNILINQNNILERELDKLKDKEKKKNLGIPKSPNYYDENLRKFINGLKMSLQKNISENIQLTKNISNILKVIDSIYNNYDINNENYINIYNKIIKEDKNNPKIKVKNYEKSYNKLKDEQIKLKKELDELKLSLNNLKNKENILSLKYESNLKSKQDYQELLLKLNNTIKRLNTKNLSISNVSSVKDIGFNTNNNSYDLYEIKKNQLKNIIKCIENQKHILIEENYKIKKQNKELNDNEKGKDNIKENELKKIFNDIKAENNKKQNDIQKQERQIKILKNIISKLTNTDKQNNIDEIKSKLNIEQQLINEDNNLDIEFKNLLKESKLNEDIKNASFLNTKKLNEMEYTTQNYEDFIKEKEEEISNLENKMSGKVGLIKTIEEKIKPLYKKNTFLRGNSFTFAKKNNLKISNNKFLQLNKSTKIFSKNNLHNDIIINEFGTNNKLQQININNIYNNNYYFDNYGKIKTGI